MPRDTAIDCTALAPGVWRVALPFPSPLRTTFSYLLRSSTGVVVIDAGWDSDEGWDTFLAGMARAGVGLEDLRGVVVTHAHPDHYGLTARIQANTDAWVGLHVAEQRQLAPTDADRTRRVESIADWLRGCGVPEEAMTDVMADRHHLHNELSGNLPSLDLHGGEVIPDTDGSLLAIHTPGHTPGHLVFHDRSRGLVFTGDHLLPRISVNVSARPTSGTDPLGDYIGSLDVLEPLRDQLAAPGHEWAFDQIGRRVDDVRRHHDDRLAEIREAVAADASTPWEVAQVVTWSRPFGTLNPRGKRSAIGETASHLIRLELAGQIVRDGSRWTSSSTTSRQLS